MAATGHCHPHVVAAIREQSAKLLFYSNLVYSESRARAAEKLVFNEYSAGAEDDISRSTSIARRMVASWGMSEAIGPVSFRQSEEHPFLGKEMHTSREFSEETARLIDTEVQKIMHDAYDSAVELLTQYREKMDALANALLEAENLERDEVAKILGERPFDNSDE